ncbi:hypothetical protein [Shewanella marisflavi]|uniref:hypothetical protein n=1 Tax=Shewanella marisflavi TaxID=260364 RepID=UPI003AACBA7E
MVIATGIPAREKRLTLGERFDNAELVNITDFLKEKEEAQEQGERPYEMRPDIYDTPTFICTSSLKK